MTLEHDIGRGQRAARLLNDPMIAEAFDTVAASLLAAWEATADGQERERERLWLMTKLLARVRGYLAEAADTGKISQMQIEQRPN